MFRATVICPDEECVAAYDAVAELEELEAMICDCGCTLRIERVCDDERALPRGATFELIALG